MAPGRAAEGDAVVLLPVLEPEAAATVVPTDGGAGPTTERPPARTGPPGAGTAWLPKFLPVMFLPLEVVTVYVPGGMGSGAVWTQPLWRTSWSVKVPGNTTGKL